MGGSFESGAGDDPDELFADEDESEEEPTTEGEAETDTDGESERTQQAEASETTMSDTSSENHEEGETASDTATSPNASDGEGQRKAPVIDFDTAGDIDTVQLAREFVPETYDKPHAWALGRNGVNDGRSEKKTFFLQSNVLDLEAACSERVNETLNGDVPLTDLRELALILAYHQPELLAEAAREWGAESA